jgi:anthranilate 1,2-dioxygenase small subunit
MIEMSRAGSDEQATLLGELPEADGLRHRPDGGRVTAMQDPMLRLELADPQGRYVAALDNDRIEEWAGLFVDDCPYAIVSKENEDAGLPGPVIHCDNIRMLRDRVVALPSANIYEKPRYWHCLSGREWRQHGDGSIAARPAAQAAG